MHKKKNEQAFIITQMFKNKKILYASKSEAVRIYAEWKSMKSRSNAQKIERMGHGRKP